MQCMASAVVTPLDDKTLREASTDTSSAAGQPAEQRRADDRRRPQATDGQTLTGFSCLIIGSLSLAFVLTGYLTGNDVVPLLVTSGTGLVGCSVWFAHSSLFRYSMFFGAFAGFYDTYALIQLGITNHWFGIPIQDLTHLVSSYVSIWFMIFLIVAWAVRFMSKLLVCIVLAIDASVAMILVANLLGSLKILDFASFPTFGVGVFSVIFVMTTLKDRRKGARRQQGAVRNDTDQRPNAVPAAESTAAGVTHIANRRRTGDRSADRRVG